MNKLSEEITKQALELFLGDEKKAKEWLNTSLDKFDGKSPLGHAQNKNGASEVVTLIGQLRHGVFS